MTKNTDFLSSSKSFYVSLGRNSISAVNKPVRFSSIYRSNVRNDDYKLISVEEIRLREYSYRFKKQINLIIKRVDNYWSLDVEKYDIHCIAQSIDEILQEFLENIDVAWKMYVECDELELTDDAKNLRNILIRDMEKVNDRD